MRRVDPPREDPYWPVSEPERQPLTEWLPGALLLVIFVVVTLSSFLDLVV